MKRLFYAFLLLLATPAVHGQCNVVYDAQRIRSVRLIVDDDAQLPPVIRLGGTQELTLQFDEMGHDYRRLVYRITHCDYKGQEGDSESLFESDYLEGQNGQPLDNYDISFNTTQLYTHYTLTLPNDDVRLRLSGNYQLLIYDEEEYNGSSTPSPLLCARFAVVENGMSIQGQVSANTDIDFNKQHQQLSYSVSYGSLPVVDPLREIRTIVRQNRRNDNAVVDLAPNIQKASGIEYTHRRELIFPAGNEFHKFETIDMHRPNLNVDYLRWMAPYYHSMLYADDCRHNYVYDEDRNGISILRNAEYDDEEITSEYTWVHFTLNADAALPNGDVYVCGQWTNGSWDPECRMTWDEEEKAYTAALYLKQGYYEYQYRQRFDKQKQNSATRQTDGDFYETENEYEIFVYYRQQGSRYDRLVGYAQIKNN